MKTELNFDSVKDIEKAAAQLEADALKIFNNSVQAEKLKKKLGKETAEQLEALTPGELDRVIVNANQAIKDAEDELEANAKYQDAKSDVAAFRGGLSDLKKQQNARIKYSLLLLADKGKI